MLALLLLLVASSAGLEQPATPPRQVAGAISNADYPASAIRAGEQGTATVSLAIGTEGQVTGCVVTGTSGSASLDTASCALVSSRFRFEPARNAGGQPVAATIERRISWRMPDATPGPAMPLLAFVSGELRFSVAPAEASQQCAVEEVGGTFTNLAEFMCSPERRAPAAEVAAKSRAMTMVMRFTPEGATPAAQGPVRGTLRGQSAVDLDFGPDGMIAGCKVVETAPPRPPIGSPCDRETFPLMLVGLSSSGQIRRARFEMRYYQLGGRN